MLRVINWLSSRRDEYWMSKYREISQRTFSHLSILTVRPFSLCVSIYPDFPSIDIILFRRIHLEYPLKYLSSYLIIYCRHSKHVKS